MNGFGFSCNGGFGLGDFAGIRVDPLQTRTLSNPYQVLHRQIVGLHFRQCVAHGYGCSGGYRCNWRNGWRSHRCYKFSSWSRLYWLGYRLIFIRMDDFRVALKDGFTSGWHFGTAIAVASALATFATFIAVATITAITVTTAAFAWLALLFVALLCA